MSWLAVGLSLKRIVGCLSSAVASFFRALNVQGWIGLATTAVAAFLFFHQLGEARHWKKQSGAFEKLYRTELANEERAKRQAVDLKDKIDGLNSRLSKALRDKNDEENRRIARDADDVRLRGPGKAICPGGPGLAASAGQSAAGGQANAAMDQVPSGARVDLIALPFAPTVDFAANHDRYRAEVMTWRDWYARLSASWPKSGTP